MKLTSVLRALPLHPVAVESPIDYSARFEAMRELLRRKGKTDSIGESPKDRPERDLTRYMRLPRLTLVGQIEDQPDDFKPMPFVSEMPIG